MSASSESAPAPRRRSRAPLERRVPDASALARAAERAGPGEALPSHLREPAERALDLPLDDLRLHRDTGAGALTGFAGARAAQWRNHVFIRPDLYQPETAAGRDLLGHELLHAGQYAVFGAGGAPLSSRSDASEGEARSLAPKVLGGEPGAARPAVTLAAAVNRDDGPQSSELSLETSDLPPQICDSETWRPEGGQPQSVDPALATTSVPDAAGPASTSPVGAQTVDPAFIDVRSMTNGELIAQDLETRQMIASFRETSAESEAWAQLGREIADDRRRRIQLGFVFMSEAREQTPALLVQLQPGPAPGITALVVADPALALGTPNVTLTGPIMSGAQLEAYLRSAGLMQVGGEQAERAIGIIGSGNLAELGTVFEQNPEARQAERDQALRDNPFLMTGLYRNTIAANRVTYSPEWLLPIDPVNARGARAVGRMGEAAYWFGPETGWGATARNLNEPGFVWRNVLGAEQSGNAPIADFYVGGGQPWARRTPTIPVSVAATSQMSQAAATRYLMHKLADALDVYGRRGATMTGPTTTARAVEHVRQLSGDPALAPNTPGFQAAQRQFLSDTAFAVPQARLDAIRNAVRQPFEVQPGSNRPATLEGYRALYDGVLRAAPIENVLLNDGSGVTISSMSELNAHLPNTLLAPADRVSGGASRGSLIQTGERTRVFRELGRMAAGRIIASETRQDFIASADLLRGVDQPGSTAEPTRVLSMDISDFARQGLRIREGLGDVRTPEGPGALSWDTSGSATSADSYLSFLRLWANRPDLQRSDPQFADLRAAATREILLAVPADQRAPLIEAVLASDAGLASDIRAALTADIPTVDMATALGERATSFDLNSPELIGTRDYVLDLAQHGREGGEARLSADALTMHQQPGLRGIARRAPGAAGRGLGGAGIGYGTTALLDVATGHDVRMPSVPQIASDVGLNVASEEAERRLAAAMASRVPISSPLLRSVAGRAGPGFVIQPLISVGSEMYSISETRERRPVTAEEERSRLLHAGGVGLTTAAAGAGTAFIIAKFTAGGAALGAPAAGVGAVPGAVIGFIVGAFVAAGAAYAADRWLIPGSAEEWEERFAAQEADRARRGAEERARRPLASFGEAGVPLPFRPSPDITPEEQIAIANWFVAQAQAQQYAEAGSR